MWRTAAANAAAVWTTRRIAPRVMQRVLMTPQCHCQCAPLSTTAALRTDAANTPPPSQPATPAAPATSSVPARPKRAGARRDADSAMFILPEPASDGKKNAKKKARGEGRPDPALQRGAPPPKPKLPTPAAIQHVDRPWMQAHITLKFALPDQAAASAQHHAPFELLLTQWTGMEEIGWKPPRRRRASRTGDVGEGEIAADAAWVEPPVLTEAQQAAEDEARAQAAAGSGTIVWDAALHLAHYLHSLPTPLSGPVLELGAGTGALGLAVDAMLNRGEARQGGAHTQVVLTDGGKVLELLQHNVTQNKAKACVFPLDWSSVSSFLSLPSLPSHFSTVLCSELLDALPSDANGHRAADAHSLSTLVHTIDQVAAHSAEVKSAAGESGGVDVWFTFEQRGLLSLGDGGVLEAQLFEPLRTRGFTVEQIHNETPYAPGSALCLFKLHMQ